VLTIDDFVAEATRYLDGTGVGPRRPPAEDHHRAALFKSRAEEEAEIPAAKAWRAAKFDAGFGWIDGPVEYGGRGLPTAYATAFDDLEAGYDVPNEGCFVPGTDFIGPVVLRHGTVALRQAVLRPLYRGDALACQLFSEPEAGSDLASLRTRARPAGPDNTAGVSGWVVNGQKVWTSRAHYSDLGILLARTGDDAERHRGITAFVVDMHAPGVTVRPLRQMTGDAPFNEVFLDDVAIPDDWRVGPVGEGWSVAMSTLAKERGAISRSRRYRPGGLADVAAPEKLADLLARTGRAADPLLRQRWADLYIRFRLQRLTADRLAVAADWTGGSGESGGSADAAPGIGKVQLARNMSDAADFVADVLGPHAVAGAPGGWAEHWDPLILGVPGMHIGGGTDQVVLNGLAERALGLPRTPR